MLVLVLVSWAGCGARDIGDWQVAAGDAGADAVAAVEDAGAVDARPSAADARVRDPDAPDARVPVVGAGRDDALRRNLGEWLAAFDHAAVARCRCQVPAGDFPSADACIEAIGDWARNLDCFANVLTEYETPELREQLRCLARETERRATCLESASCADTDIGGCSVDQFGCPMLNPQMFTQLFRRCLNGVVIPRSSS